MDTGILDSSSPALATDSPLRDARLLNSDIGRHSVKCNFSARLAGRFYHNGSLERHTLRKSRLVEMQARKRRLERELQLEERRVELLEERLGDTERAREDAHELIGTIERGVVRFQSYARRRQALRSFRTMRHEWLTRSAIAIFFQRHYRGWKGRLRAESRREHLRQKRREENATIIQARVRRLSQRNMYLELLAKREALCNRSAAVIQSMLRGKVTRRAYLDEIARRQGAARNIQQIWRGAAVRVMVDELRQEAARKRIEAEKPKRVPLHLRRYSTYGANNNRRGGNNKLNKRDVRLRRRSSDAMIIVKDGRLTSLASHLKHHSSASFGGGGDPDENDSVGTTITSLTNRTDATDGSCQKQRRPSSRHRSRVSWHTRPRMVPASPSSACKNNGKNNGRVGDSRRGSLERRRTISGGSIQKLSRERSSGAGRPSRRQPSLKACDESDNAQESAALQDRPESSGGGGGDKNADPSSPGMKRDERHESGGDDDDDKSTDPSSPERPDGRDAIEPPRTTSSPARREDVIKTPITVSEEASFIVQEVLGKSVMRHSIVHSKFEEEFGEREDDLE